MSLAAMSPVKIKRIAGKNPAHDRGNRRCPGAKQEVEMIPEQRPGITGSPGLYQVLSQALQKRIPVSVIPEYGPALNTSGNDVMQGPWSINTRLTRHTPLISETSINVNL
jgi:hypothetical protein